MFRLEENFSVFRNFFDKLNFSLEDCTFLWISYIFMQLNVVRQLAPVTGKVVTGDLAL